MSKPGEHEGVGTLASATADGRVDFLTLTPYVGGASAPCEYARSSIPSVCRKPGAFFVSGPVP